MEASSRARSRCAQRLDELSRPPPASWKAKDVLTRQPRGRHGRRAARPRRRAVRGRAAARRPARRCAGRWPTRRASPRSGPALARRLFGVEAVGRPPSTCVETVARQRWSRPIDLVDAMTALGHRGGARRRRRPRRARRRRGRAVPVRPHRRRRPRARPDPQRPQGVRRGQDRPAGPAAVRPGQPGHRAAAAQRADRPARRQRRVRRRAAVRGGQPPPRPVGGPRDQRGRADRPSRSSRLVDSLTRLYGRTVGLQVTVDPSVLGGLVVQVGDEVIDGSIAHRLEAASRRLAG